MSEWETLTYRQLSDQRDALLLRAERAEAALAKTAELLAARVQTEMRREITNPPKTWLEEVRDAALEEAARLLENNEDRDGWARTIRELKSKAGAP